MSFFFIFLAFFFFKEIREREKKRGEILLKWFTIVRERRECTQSVFTILFYIYLSPPPPMHRVYICGVSGRQILGVVLFEILHLVFSYYFCSTGIFRFACWPFFYLFILQGTRTRRSNKNNGICFVFCFLLEEGGGWSVWSHRNI